MKEHLGIKLPYPKAQIRQGAEPNATGRVGADGETGDFKRLTLSNSGPIFLGSRGFFRQGADRVSASILPATGRDFATPRWAAGHDQPTNAWLARGSVHPNLCYIKYKSPNRTRFKHGDTSLSLPEYSERL